MEPAILAAYDRPVPRYTSYPTAAQFGTAVGPDQHADWLKDLNGGAAALYVHVPFCRELCWYCACHTMAMRRPAMRLSVGNCAASQWVTFGGFGLKMS